MGCDQIKICKSVDSYKPFIFKSWLTSYKHSSKFAKRIPDYVFYKFHHAIIERLLAISTVSVAHLSEESNVIVGFLVIQKFATPIIHYVYVKEAFRRMGVMTALIEASGIDMNRAQFTHWTECFCDDCKERFEVAKSLKDRRETHWIKVRYPKLIYNPYVI